MLRAHVSAGILIDVTFTAHPGHITGLIGPNGAGKTTLFKCIAGLMECEGSITLDDAPLDELSARQRARTLALLEQDSGDGFGFSVRDVVAMGRTPYLRRFEQPDEADYHDALVATGLLELQDRPVRELSGGQRQLVHIARCLAQDTPVWLADEPVSALDVRHQLLVLDLLQSRAQEGRVVVAVLHDLNQAARWCDQLVMLDHGQIHAAGSPEDVLTPQLLHEHYGVNAEISHNSHGWLDVTVVSSTERTSC